LRILRHHILGKLLRALHREHGHEHREDASVMQIRWLEAKPLPMIE
jgi:hypothetical protein